MLNWHDWNFTSPDDIGSSMGCYTTAMQYTRRMRVKSLKETVRVGSKSASKTYVKSLEGTHFLLNFTLIGSLGEKTFKPNPISRARKMKLINFVHDINKSRFEKVCCSFEIVVLR